jgi:hypothetical protein
MKGNVAKGHGGCCGTFKKGPIIQSAVTSLNDPTIVKKSSISTMGMLETKYAYYKRPAKLFAGWKPDNNQNLNDQHTYISNLAKKTLLKVNTCTNKTNSKAPSSCKNTIAGVNTCYNSKNIQLQTNDSVLSEGEYLIQLAKKCTGNDIVYIPKPIRGVPFGCGLSKK